MILTADQIREDAALFTAAGAIRSDLAPFTGDGNWAAVAALLPVLAVTT